MESFLHLCGALGSAHSNNVLVTREMTTRLVVLLTANNVTKDTNMLL